MLLTQAVFLALCGALGILFFAPSSALSFVTGGTLSIFSHAVFSFYTFRYSGASNNRAVVDSMKKGNKVKLLLTVIAFMIIFNVPYVTNFEAVMGYGVMMLVHYPIMLTLHARLND